MGEMLDSSLVASGSLLQCRKVGYSYGDTQVLASVDLGVERGEVVGILGESGSGKTTLLKLIAGILEPSLGHIDLEDADVTLVPPWRRRIGYVPQNYALFPHLSVGDNIAYALRVRRERRRERCLRARALLSAVGLSGLERRRVNTLSGGQQQRVALARALAAKPAILLLDEPFAAVDRNVRVDLRHEIRSLVKDLQMTTICVTHDVDEAFDFADRVALLAHGIIQQIDTPEKVYFHPSNLSVAKFLNPRNILDGCLIDRDHQEVTVRIQGSVVEIAVPDHTWPAGLERAHLVIRPEVIRLNQDQGQVSCSLRGVVAEIRSLGTRDLLSVALDTDGPRVFAELLRPHPELRLGQGITVHFAKEDIHVLPA
jgi:ABC-type Fe3+/spermidine/putrescine transport system ATPase subunit